MKTLEQRLNAIGRRGLTIKEVNAVGVNVLAATTPISSFIGKFQGVRIYAFHDYPTNTWTVENA